MKLLAGEVGMLAADAVGRIVANTDTYLDRATLTVDAASLRDVWVQLTAGGWDRLMLQAEDDGAGADLVDLLPLAETWGRYLVALPLLETIVLRRWTSDDDSLIGHPLSGLLPNGIAPFACEPRVVTLTGVDPPRVSAQAGGQCERDAFAPSLPLGILTEQTFLPAQCTHALQVLVVATAVGAASMALERTVDYAKNREAFGRTIGHFQAVKHRLANMHVDLELARTAVLWAAQDASAGARPLHSAITRAQGIAAGAIQLHGGNGFTWDAGVHRYMRHVLAVSKVMKDTLADDGGGQSIPSTVVEEHAASD
jgi:alkylation response protein AidB-like acyl-CoA dehydrogenase